MRSSTSSSADWRRVLEVAVKPIAPREQLRLFHEVVEVRTTRDRVAGDAVWMMPPPGRGWRVLDAHRERHTQLQRRRPVVLPRRWGRKC